MALVEYGWCYHLEGRDIDVFGELILNKSISVTGKITKCLS